MRRRGLGLVSVVAVLLGMAAVAAVMVMIDGFGLVGGEDQPPEQARRDQVIRRATDDATRSWPEMGMLDARVDEVTAERITLGEADRRAGWQRGSGGYAPGQDAETPVWWVTVRGYFRFHGMSAPGGKPDILEADEQSFIYDARTGEYLGHTVPRTHSARAAGPTSSTSSALGVDDVVAKLRAKGLNADPTGEAIPPLFGAGTGEIVRVDGKAVQVYAFDDDAAAGTALTDATQGPAGRVVEWVARPHFVQMGNLLITIVTDDEAFAASVTAALR